MLRVNTATKNDHAKLYAWYLKNYRTLPWRRNKDPYRIWISEVMLQQTTVTAVIPYYEKFLSKFPTVQHLARAKESQVLELWSGLGYYSRARNLHKSAQMISKNGFPKTAHALLELPGFGPYTSAAVASIAFDEKIGVLDGNVIRVLCRRFGLNMNWWETAQNRTLQELSNRFAQEQPGLINQALMELGATVCTPKSPACMLCPWIKSCEAHQQSLTNSIPKPRPRKKIEMWTWSIELHLKKDLVGLVQNTQGPVLKKQWLFPGKFKQVTERPQKFHVRHGITHHDLFILIQKKTTPTQKLRWVKLQNLSAVTPSKILKKIIDASLLRKLS
jgi:A/G-specific adenine glycosylase